MLDVAVGDDVELNQMLCTVDTAKGEVEIPSPYDGRIVERAGAEGDVLKVGAVLVRIDTASAATDGEIAAPTLVGYGADTASTPADGRTGHWRPHGCASWPKIC